MRVHFQHQRVAAGFVAALFLGLSSCATAGVGVGGGVTLRPDAVDQGGQLQESAPECQGGEDILYRYVARTFGGHARIDEFCSAGADAPFTGQPPEAIEGSCPGTLCGQATTWRRGPIEHALLQAVVSLERSKATRLEMMRRSSQELHELYEVELSKGTTRFRLNAGVECIANLELFKEHADAGVRPGDEVISPEELSFFYDTEASISRGSIWVEQNKNGPVHDLLIIVESAFEGRVEAELYKERILCKSERGPIRVLESPVYGFRVERASLDEWGVHAFRR